MNGAKRADNLSLRKEKVRTEDDYSYIEKLARPKKNTSHHKFTTVQEEVHCRFKPDLSATSAQTKSAVQGKFADRLGQYIREHKAAREKKYEDPQATFKPKVNPHPNQENEKSSVQDRCMSFLKERERRRKEKLSAPGGTFKPDLSKSQKSATIPRKSWKKLEKTSFLERNKQTIKNRESAAKARLKLKNAPDGTFKPKLVAKQTHRLSANLPSFEERMRSDITRRDTKEMYRALLFNLPMPKQKRTAGTLGRTDPECVSCCARLARNAKFCAECGFRVADVTEKPHTKRPQTARTQKQKVQSGTTRSPKRPQSASRRAASNNPLHEEKQHPMNTYFSESDSSAESSELSEHSSDEEDYATLKKLK